MLDLDSMCKEIGIGEGSHDLWHAIPEKELCLDAICPLNFDNDVQVLLNILVYSNCITVFTTAKDMCYDMSDFLFTQHAIDERVQKVVDMME